MAFKSSGRAGNPDIGELITPQDLARLADTDDWKSAEKWRLQSQAPLQNTSRATSYLAPIYVDSVLGKVIPISLQEDRPGSSSSFISEDTISQSARSRTSSGRESGAPLLQSSRDDASIYSFQEQPVYSSATAGRPFAFHAQLSPLSKSSYFESKNIERLDPATSPALIAGPEYYATAYYGLDDPFDEDQIRDLKAAAEMDQGNDMRAKKYDELLRKRRQQHAMMISAREVEKSTGHGLCGAPPPREQKVYDDESIIAVSISVINKPIRRTLTSRIIRPPKTKFFTAQMPRGDYLKYFAKDDKGLYIGTEPLRLWTEEEVELKFGKYRTLKEKSVFEPLKSVISTKN